MTYEFKYLLKLLYCSIHKKEIDLPQQEIDWQALTVLANNHMVLSIIYPTLLKLAEKTDIPMNMQAMWKDFSFKTGFSQIRKRGYLLNVLKAAKAHNIDVMLIKGPLISDLYPVPNARISVDADIVIKESDENKVHDMLVDEQNYKREEEIMNGNEITYYYEDFCIEVHTSLWEDSIDKYYYDALTSLDLTNFDKAIPDKINNVDILTMNVDSTLIYLFFHLTNHFFVSGIGIRYLSDITLYIEKYHSKIDWTAFWENAKLLKYYDFCKIFFAMCIKYLNLNPDYIKNYTASEKDFALGERMLEDMEDGGHNGKATPERLGMANLLSICKFEEGKKPKISMKQFLQKQKRTINKENKASNSEEGDKSTAKSSKMGNIFRRISYSIKNRKTNGSHLKRIKYIKKRAQLMQDLNILYHNEHH